MALVKIVTHMHDNKEMENNVDQIIAITEKNYSKMEPVNIVQILKLHLKMENSVLKYYVNLVRN